MRALTRAPPLQKILLGCAGLLSTATVRAFAPPPGRGDDRIHQTRLAVVPSDLKIVFSDVDGALIHYPKNHELREDADDGPPVDGEVGRDNETNEILSLPPSATGMRGIISSAALASCRDLRRDGTVLVLVSGMRTSTLLGRLPYLPRADAYCTEAGGRIFYPTEANACCEFEAEGSSGDEDPFPFRQATPLAFSGSDPASDLTPFGLREDEEWRSRMEMSHAAGGDGYPGNEVSSDRCDALDDDEECTIDYDNPIGFPKPSDVVPVDEREGELWEFARTLRRDEGLVLDTKSYSTCFRVNKKHQANVDSGTEKFQRLLDGDIKLPSGLAKSTNLGCIDIYPVSSGKLNCCQYIADRLGIDMSAESVCICDDDNDIEMALGCSHAFIPALTSTSVVETMERYPTKFTQTYVPGVVESTAATEAALRAIQDGVASALANEAALELIEDDVSSATQNKN